MERTSAVVLLSGGMDSVWCLHWATREHERALALFVDYGQRAARQEEQAARRAAARLQVQISTFQLRLSARSPLCSTSRPLRGGVDADGISHAFVPGLNLHLLMIAAAHARTMSGPLGSEVGAVVIGCCADDAEVFPDAKVDFMLSATSAIGLALSRQVDVRAPLLLKTRAEMLASARERAEVWDAVRDSWSCYAPTKSGQQCGACDACAQRERAFAAVS